MDWWCDTDFEMAELWFYFLPHHPMEAMRAGSSMLQLYFDDTLDLLLWEVF